MNTRRRWVYKVFILFCLDARNESLELDNSLLCKEIMIRRIGTKVGDMRRDHDVCEKEMTAPFRFIEILI